MKFNSWLRRIGSLSIRRPRQRRKHHQNLNVARAQTALESLEDRALLATFTVDNLNDSGTGSLRQAVTDANNTAGADDIDLSGVSGVITLSGAHIEIAESVTIDGPGAGNLTINAAGNSRVFDIVSGSTDVTIAGLTLTGGVVGDGINGASIRTMSSGTLTVRESTVTGNTAGRYGGAIYSTTTDIVIENSTLSQNMAGEWGGGIFTLGALTVSSSLVAGNSAVRFGGGAIAAFSNDTTIANSTISGNTSGTVGGGIYGSTTQSLITNSTIAGNTAGTAGGGMFSNGGGTATLTNTIVAGNRNATAADDHSGDRFETASTNNLIGNALTAGGLTHDADGDPAAGSNNIVGVDWMTVLQNDGTDPTLADNGGLTQTIALRSASPAIDTGTPNFDATGLPSDQRGDGFDRVLDGNGDGTATIDIGAFESPTVPGISIGNAPAITEGSDSIFLVTLTDAATGTVTVNYSTSDGSGVTGARGGEDFVSQTDQVLTFTPGQTQRSITIVTTDDANSEATESFGVALLTVSGAAILNGSATGTIEDNDPAALTVEIGADAVNEGDGPGATTATVSRNTDTTNPLTVTLASSNTAEVTVLSTITIPGGETTIGFFLDAVDDNDVDGTKTVTITASATDHADATDTIMVTDNDTASLTVNIAAASIDEADGATATTGTVTRNGDTAAALTVNLSSDDTSEATVPGTVTIDAGQTTSAAFNIAAVNDSDVDGTQTVTLTASATGLNSGTDTIDVTDDDVVPDFVVTSPTGFIQDQRPTVTWAAVDGALSYNLYLNIDNGGGNVFRQLEVSNTQTSLVIPQDLEFARYRVFVEANMPGDVIRKQDQGHTFVVEVKADLTPVGATTDTSPQFTWNRVPGAASYIIFINQPGSPVIETVQDPGSGNMVTHTISSSLARNDYKWWVRPVRQVQENTFLGPWSDASEFSTGGRTKVTSPARGATVSDNIVTFSWPSVPDAQHVEIYVSRTGTPGALYRDAGVLGNTFRSRILENGDYKVWIRTTLSDGSGVWGSGVDFTVDATTNGLTTTPISPANPGFNASPEFTWQDVPGATSFDVYLHSGILTILHSGITDTSWTRTVDLTDGAWTWSVRANNDSGTGAWSTPIAFSTNGLTQLTSPGSTTTDRTPTFTWNEVSGATSYSLQVDNRTTGTANVIREDGLTEASFIPTTDFAPGTYRAWVRAVSSSVTGPWSFQFDFVVAAADVESQDEEPDLVLTSLPSRLTNRADDAAIVLTVDHEADVGGIAVSSPPRIVSDATEGATGNDQQIDAQFVAVSEWLGSM